MNSLPAVGTSYRFRLVSASLMTALGLLVTANSRVCGAELVINYDVSVPGAWEGGGLMDSLGAAPVQMALPGVTVEEFAVIAGQEGFHPDISGPEDFGPPVFIAKTGPGGRSYLSFEKLGGLSADNAAIAEQKPECTGGAFLNSDGAAGGYTMEMLVRIQPDYRHTIKGAIGGGGQTSLENNFLGLSGKTAATVTTVLETGGMAPTPETFDRFQIVMKLPFEDIVIGDWVHLVKVHDPASKTMSFYLDGQLVEEADLSTLPEAGEYPAREEYKTLVGAKTRRFQGIDFSFLRAYRGAMTAQEVGKLYQASLKAP